MAGARGSGRSVLAGDAEGVLKPGGQRIKGASFERRIARMLRERYGADVHRSSQADRARNSDVVIEPGPGVPANLPRLWLELNDALRPDPIKKLAQAERDIAREEVPGRVPVVVWHRLGEREVYASLRLYDLDWLCGVGHERAGGPMVTMTLGDFLEEVTRDCEVDRLPDSERGASGFGSTGR